MGDQQRGRRGRCRRGHGRLLAHRAPVGRPRPRDGCLQRLPHAPVRHRPRRMERRDGRAVRRVPGQPASGRRLERANLGHRRRRSRRCCRPHHRHRRRSAGGVVRPGVHRGRDGEEHLRHRLIRAHANGRPSRRFGVRHADHGCVAARRQAELRARRRHLRHRRGAPMAA